VSNCSSPLLPDFNKTKLSKNSFKSNKDFYYLSPILFMLTLIGDIHGHADKLETLLQKIGFSKSKGIYRHPEMKALFVGDYIDRGPQIPETLEIVRRMVEEGQAIALMGNHEYNALCFHFQETEGGHLRKHLIKNIIQHYETLRQFQNRQEEYENYLEWFKTLPLYYEDEECRAVHACWDVKNIALLRNTLKNDCLTDDLIYESVKIGSPFNRAIEETLKGKEMALPNGNAFTDKDGNQRHEIRIKWWEDPSTATYSSISIEPLDLPDIPITPLPNTGFYPSEDKRVFFGHYWLKGQPALFKNNICCLDYSVAKGGKLVAYRMDQKELTWV
jgi:hypothetical protein